MTGPRSGEAPPAPMRSGGRLAPVPTWGDEVRYLTDARDDDQPMELVARVGGNGDFFLGTWPEGTRSFGPMVQFCTSGGARAVPGLAPAVGLLYRVLLAHARGEAPDWADTMADQVLRGELEHAQTALEEARRDARIAKAWSDHWRALAGQLTETIQAHFGEDSEPAALAGVLRELIAAVRPLQEVRARGEAPDASA